MNSLNEAKAALLGCSCKSQVMSVVDAFCSKTRFDYSADLSLSDNAMIAQRMEKPKVANVLSFAAQQLERLWEVAYGAAGLKIPEKLKFCARMILVLLTQRVIVMQKRML